MRLSESIVAVHVRKNTMKGNISVRAGLSTLAFVTAALLLAPGAGYSQTQGMERRDDRRDDRGDARDTRQEGRDAARDAKDACKDAGDSRSECRQEKRDTKQDSRQDARDIKKNDE
jgi:hypothetical protein